MATQAKEKDKEKKPAKDKAPKADAAPAAEAPKAAPAPAPPREPADPRLKVLKKFRGKFLPKGPLRERHRAIMARWDSGEDHGNVGLDELKALLDDWRGTQAIPPRAPKG